MNFHFYDLKLYFPSMSPIVENSPELLITPYNAEDVGNFDFCISGWMTVSEWISVLSYIFLVNIINTLS